MSPKRSGATRNKITNTTAMLFIGGMSVCLIAICFAGVFLIGPLVNPDRVVSNPTSEPPLPVERIIELTFSASNAQTATLYSPAPLTTLEPAATIYETRTSLPVFETSTPFVLFSPVYETSTPLVLPLPSATNQNWRICSCSSDKYDCDDFSTRKQAQACFNHCIDAGAGDVHKLDTR